MQPPEPTVAFTMRTRTLCKRNTGVCVCVFIHQLNKGTNDSKLNQARDQTRKIRRIAASVNTLAVCTHYTIQSISPIVSR